MSHSHTTTTTTTTSSNNKLVMSMAFHTSITDNLFSNAWAPKTIGQYAGTCIFLIAFAAIHRALTAFKRIQDAKWNQMERARVVVIAGERGTSERSNSEGDSKAAGVVARVESGNKGQGEGVGNPWAAPWRFSTELPRAGLTTVVSGIGYLLMLAVMTFNVGYFMSVLAGIFVGELVFGRVHKHPAQ